MTTRDAQRYQDRKAQGLCPKCGTRPDKGYTLCQECRKRYNAEGTSNQGRQNRKAYKRKLKEDVINGYGGKCACCGETELSFLTIDHVNGGGTKERLARNKATIYPRLRREGYPPGFQVLCWNCNAAKHFQGTCPHQAA